MNVKERPALDALCAWACSGRRERLREDEARLGIPPKHKFGVARVMPWAYESWRVGKFKLELES